MVTKSEIRRRIREKRRQMAAGEKLRMDEAIRQRLLAMRELTESDVVYSYMSFGGEVDTICLMEELWRQGGKVAVPRVEGDEIRFYMVNRMDELVPGCRGILEPVQGCAPALDLRAPVIAPGMAFSMEGERIGYGGGYYDRFFEKEPLHVRIAVAYPFQIYEKLQTEECDQRVHKIVIPEGIYEGGTLWI